MVAALVMHEELYRNPLLFVLKTLIFIVIPVILISVFGNFISWVTGYDSPENVQKRIALYEASGRTEADNCMSKMTPWQCLKRMSYSDEDSYRPRGTDFTRVSYLVKTVPAIKTLQFCVAAGQENCPEKLVEYGYANQDVFEAMKSIKP